MPKLSADILRSLFTFRPEKNLDLHLFRHITFEPFDNKTLTLLEFSNSFN